MDGRLERYPYEVSTRYFSSKYLIIDCGAFHLILNRKKILILSVFPDIQAHQTQVLATLNKTDS